MKNFAIAGIQMNALNGDNLDAISRQIATLMLRFPWVQMVILGELSIFGTSLRTAQPMPGPAENHFCSLARKHNIWLLPGSMYEMNGEQIYNTTPVINPQGEVVIRHRKLFPFEPYETGVASGDQHTVFEVPGVARFGVSICYDMWFPETVRALVHEGAEVILHPTLTDTLDRDLELSIARAAAVSNQCYFVDINSCGDLGNGKSLVLGPEGDIIHQAGEAEQMIPLRLDLDRIRESRENGIMGLGQPLKSFRDSQLSYPQYQPGAHSDALQQLGKLQKPQRPE